MKQLGAADLPKIFRALPASEAVAPLALASNSAESFRALKLLAVQRLFWLRSPGAWPVRTVPS